MSKDIWTFKDTLAGKILTMVMSVILVTSTISTDALAFALNNPDADAAPVADVADSTKVAFEISEGASVEVAGADGQPVAVKNGDVVEAPSHEALTFAPAAEKGYTLESVTLGDKALEAKEDGKYEIAADDMAGDPLTVKVKALAEVEAVPEEAPAEEEPAAEKAPAEEEGPAAEEAADPAGTPNAADAVVPEEAKTVEQTEETAPQRQNTLALDYSSSTLAGSSDYIVEVGEKVIIKGSDGYSHAWKVDKKDIASISGNWSSATLTGKKSGTVTVTHEYVVYEGLVFPREVEKSETFTVEVKAKAPKTYTVSFNSNGGSGSQSSLTVNKVGDNVVLPECTFTAPSNKVFVGWSTERNTDPTTANGAKKLIYPGALYQVNSNQTLYAIWANESASGNTEVKLYIRLDGSIVAEPADASDVPTSAYTHEVGSGFTSGNTLIKPIFIADSTGVNVRANLKQVPSDEDIKTAIRASDQPLRDSNGEIVNLDDNNYRIIWYVLKYDASDGWHVDGTVIRAESAVVNYDQNTSATLTGSTVQPQVHSFKPADSTAELTVKNNSMQAYGYRFVGWNTKKDGSGTQYAAGSSITVNRKDNITLYAQWEEVGAVTVNYIAEPAEAGILSRNSEQLNPEIGTPKGNKATTKDNYVFEGWFNGSEKITESLELSPEQVRKQIVKKDDGTYEGVTLTAKWSKIEASVSIDDWTYDGNKAGSGAHPISQVLKSTLSSDHFGDPVFTYAQKIEGVWVPIIPLDAPSNVGEYKVIATWNEDPSGLYKTFSTEDTFTITPATLTVTTGTASRQYNGQKPLASTTARSSPPLAPSKAS